MLLKSFAVAIILCDRFLRLTFVKDSCPGEAVLISKKSLPFLNGVRSLGKK
jgi:hypothetical protein